VLAKQQEGRALSSEPEVAFFRCVRQLVAPSLDT
jgi:hypothetical protein